MELHRAFTSVFSQITEREGADLGAWIFRLLETSVRSIKLKPALYYSCVSVSLWATMFKNAPRPERMTAFQQTFEYIAFHEIINPVVAKEKSLFKFIMLALLFWVGFSGVSMFEFVNRLVTGGCAFELQVLANLVYVCAGFTNLVAGLADEAEADVRIRPVQWSQVLISVRKMIVSVVSGVLAALLFSSDYSFFFTSVIVPLRLTCLTISAILHPFLNQFLNG